MAVKAGQLAVQHSLRWGPCCNQRGGGREASQLSSMPLANVTKSTFQILDPVDSDPDVHGPVSRWVKAVKINGCILYDLHCSWRIWFRKPAVALEQRGNWAEFKAQCTSLPYCQTRTSQRSTHLQWIQHLIFSEKRVVVEVALHLLYNDSWSDGKEVTAFMNE